MNNPQWNDLDKENAEATTVSRVVCISPPSPFVDVMRHIGSLSSTFQIQIWLSMQMKQWKQLRCGS